MSTSNHVTPLFGTDQLQHDPYGEAALLMTESLIHTLLERSALSSDDALSILQVAIDAQAEIDHDRGGNPARPSRALGILASIQATLQIDAS